MIGSWIHIWCCFSFGYRLFLTNRTWRVISCLGKANQSQINLEQWLSRREHTWFTGRGTWCNEWWMSLTSGWPAVRWPGPSLSSPHVNVAIWFSWSGVSDPLFLYHINLSQHLVLFSPYSFNVDCSPEQNDSHEWNLKRIELSFILFLLS